ncbi:MAG: DNA-3-methyladenine glycosylase 2 family protein [Patescibacteria group bacterium]
MKAYVQHKAVKHLKKVDPLLHAAALPHYETVLAKGMHRRNYSKLFAHLAGSIVSQQLSTKAADTIWGRLKGKCKGEVTAETILKLRITSMRSAGLSAAKIKALKELAKAVQSGEVDFKKLAKLPEEEAITTLSSVWGIGRWTAEMFLMFALLREDIFSLGDLGLTRSMETLYGIPKDSPKAVYLEISEKWSPYRSTASRVLWRLRDTKSYR